MFISTENRTSAPEIMDDFEMTGSELESALIKIAKINQLLGGNKITINGIEHLIKSIDKEKEISIIDLGCGNGDMLRKIADFGIENNLNFKLTGIDANQFTIDCAKKLSVSYPNIKFEKENIFNAEFENYQPDIFLCTLTIHHFSEEEILKLLKKLYQNSSIGIIINDLHRNIFAYRLFQVLCLIFMLKNMTKHDGLTSILRGFKKQELLYFSKKLNFEKYLIKWKWAFRYQWIIFKSLKV